MQVSVSIRAGAACLPSLSYPQDAHQCDKGRRGASHGSLAHPMGNSTPGTGTESKCSEPDTSARATHSPSKHSPHSPRRGGAVSWRTMQPSCSAPRHATLVGLLTHKSGRDARNVAVAKAGARRGEEVRSPRQAWRRESFFLRNKGATLSTIFAFETFFAAQESRLLGGGAGTGRGWLVTRERAPSLHRAPHRRGGNDRLCPCPATF